MANNVFDYGGSWLTGGPQGLQGWEGTGLLPPELGGPQPAPQGVPQTLVPPPAFQNPNPFADPNLAYLMSQGYAPPADPGVPQFNAAEFLASLGLNSNLTPLGNSNDPYGQSLTPPMYGPSSYAPQIPDSPVSTTPSTPPAAATGGTVAGGTAGAVGATKYPGVQFGDETPPPTLAFQGIDPQTMQQQIAGQQSTLAQQTGALQRGVNQQLGAGGFRNAGPGATALHALLGSRQAGQNADIRRNTTMQTRQYNAQNALPYAQYAGDQYNQRQNRAANFTLGQQGNKAGVLGSLLSVLS